MAEHFWGGFQSEMLGLSGTDAIGELRWNTLMLSAV
jgi:hypothetical protein